MFTPDREPKPKHEKKMRKESMTKEEESVVQLVVGTVEAPYEYNWCPAWDQEPSRCQANDINKKHN